MHIGKRIAVAVICLLIFFSPALAQETPAAQKPRLQVIGLGLGIRVFEIQEFGSQAYNLAPLMKDPVGYKRFIDNQTYSGFAGGRVITVVPQHRLFVEFRKTGTASRFWKKNTVQAGLFLNNRFQTSSMALFDDGRATDSTIY